jgi:hypothetical protein
MVGAARFETLAADRLEGRGGESSRMMIHGSDFLTFGSAGASIGSSLMVIAAIGWATP